MLHRTHCLLRGVVLVTSALALGALNGCASTGADGASEPTQEQRQDRRDDPFYVPFSA